MSEKNITIINLTHRELNIYRDDNGDKIIENIPSSGVVRVKEVRVKEGEINGVPLYKISYSESEGLPEPKEKTYYFVSLIVAQANPHRNDLLLSEDLVRDESGAILGCKAFAVLNERSEEIVCPYCEAEAKAYAGRWEKDYGKYLKKPKED